MEPNPHRSKMFPFACLSVLFLANAFAGSATTSEPPTSAPADATITFPARDHSNLRRLLDAATSAPVTANNAAVVDEIFWDAFELCGDGVIDSASEQCDRTDFGGATCMSEGFQDGTLFVYEAMSN
jgi:hypothetical protein